MRSACSAALLTAWLTAFKARLQVLLGMHLASDSPPPADPGLRHLEGCAPIGEEALRIGHRVVAHVLSRWTEPRGVVLVWRTMWCGKVALELADYSSCQQPAGPAHCEATHLNGWVQVPVGGPPSPEHLRSLLEESSPPGRRSFLACRVRTNSRDHARFTVGWPGPGAGRVAFACWSHIPSSSSLISLVSSLLRHGDTPTLRKAACPPARCLASFAIMESQSPPSSARSLPFSSRGTSIRGRRGGSRQRFQASPLAWRQTTRTSPVG